MKRTKAVEVPLSVYEGLAEQIRWKLEEVADGMNTMVHASGMVNVDELGVGVFALTYNAYADVNTREDWEYPSYTEVLNVSIDADLTFYSDPEGEIVPARFDVRKLERYV